MENKIDLQQIKNDITTYKLYALLEDFVLHQDENSTLSISMRYDRGEVFIILDKEEEGVKYRGIGKIVEIEFLEIEEKDFDRVIGEILMYNMIKEEF